MSSSKNDEKMFEGHVNGSLVAFSVVMSIFVVLKAACLRQIVDKDQATINLTRNVSTLVIVALFFVFSYLTNLSATENKMICGVTNNKVAFFATLIPFVFVYLIGICLISIFPGWVRCFSNTFGSSFISFFGLECMIVDKPTSPSSASSHSITAQCNKLYEDYKENPRILLNELEIDASGNVLGLPFTDSSSNQHENINKFKQYIYSKETIGEGIWQLLLGIITILVSYNTLLSEKCNAFTIKKDDFNKYLNDKLKKN